jgi:hypothetical protein
LNSNQWQNISPEEARSKNRFGFGGWLIGFYIYALFLVGWHLSSLLGDGSGMLMMFETPENVAKMRVVLMIKTVLWIPFLVLTPLRHRLMPMASMACLVAATLIDSFAVTFLLELDQTKVLAIDGFNLLILTVYAVYLTRSKRVNLTYRLRERDRNQNG